MKGLHSLWVSSNRGGGQRRRAGKDGESKGGGKKLKNSTLLDEQNEVFISSHYTVVTPAHTLTLWSVCRPTSTYSFNTPHSRIPGFTDDTRLDLVR